MPVLRLSNATEQMYTNFFGIAICKIQSVVSYKIIGGAVGMMYKYSSKDYAPRNLGTNIVTDMMYISESFRHCAVAVYAVGDGE